MLVPVAKQHIIDVQQYLIRYGKWSATSNFFPCSQDWFLDLLIYHSYKVDSVVVGQDFVEVYRSNPATLEEDMYFCMFQSLDRKEVMKFVNRLQGRYRRHRITVIQK